jgi:hypothetical protein
MAARIFHDPPLLHLPHALGTQSFESDYFSIDIVRFDIEVNALVTWLDALDKEVEVAALQ